MRIDIAYSPCPNDTYIFHALAHSLIDTDPFELSPFLADVETLNEAAFSGCYGVTKLSMHAMLRLEDRYEVLSSGAALGWGCGPLLIARTPDLGLCRARIAVPGGHTTAALLLRLWNSCLKTVEVLRYDEIMPAIARREFDAGVIIHEGRFVYPEYGCVRVVDLGQWWEDTTGLPVPLGCIAVRKDLARHKGRVEALIRESIQYAHDNPGASRAYVRAHASELREEVIAGHISLYVNEYSMDLGDAGRQAIETLREYAREKGVL